MSSVNSSLAHTTVSPKIILMRAIFRHIILICCRIQHTDFPKPIPYYLSQQEINFIMRYKKQCFNLSDKQEKWMNRCEYRLRDYIGKYADSNGGI